MSEIQSSQGAEKTLEQIGQITSAIYTFYEEPGTFSISAASFGENIRSYGVVVVFHDKLVTFFEVQYYLRQDQWTVINLNVKANSNPTALMNQIPPYFFTNRTISNPITR